MFNYYRLFKSALLGLKNKLLCLKSLIYLIIRIIKIIKRRYKGSIKIYSLKLNMKPYNKLSKEVEDFRDLYNKYIYT